MSNTTHTIAITPNRKGNRYTVTDTNGNTLATNARTPLLTAARRLEITGQADPADRIEMKRHGSDRIDAFGTVGTLAKLDVSETDDRGPVYVVYMPAPYWAEQGE